MPLPFLTRHPLEFAHIRGADGGPDHGQVVDLRCVLVSLVVFEEELQVLHVLELDVAEVDGRAVQLVGSQPAGQRLGWLARSLRTNLWARLTLSLARTPWSRPCQSPACWAGFGRSSPFWDPCPTAP